MYEPLTINQLIECMENETPCYIALDADKIICNSFIIVSMRLTAVKCEIDCKGFTFNGLANPFLIGLSEDHALALWYSSELEEVQKRIKNEKIYEKELMEKLVQFVKKINGE